jgi:hypothetical protein
MTDRVRELEPLTLARSWVNTNRDSRGIVGVRLRSVEGKLRITVEGAANGSPVNWGEVEVEAVYAENADSRRSMAFVARYHFGFLDTLLEGNVNSGLLVLAAFHTFRDQSRRANYFAREFFREVVQ